MAEELGIALSKRWHWSPKPYVRLLRVASNPRTIFKTKNASIATNSVCQWHSLPLDWNYDASEERSLALLLC
jgi:hypothetical protein